MSLEINEFFVYCINNIPVYRITIGDLIGSEFRETFKSNSACEKNQKTGSIGFADYMTSQEIINQGTDYFSGLALVLIGMGIEPQYQGKGHGYFLLGTIEERAKSKGLNTIITYTKEEPMRKILRKRGYLFYNSDNKAIKNL